MYDRDIYYPNKAVEEFLKSLKLTFNKDYPTITVWISTANPYDYWPRKLYNTKLTEEEYES